MKDVRLECRGVTKYFGGLRALDEVSVAFRSKEITAVVGPNGAGKTTLFHVISGALQADAGDIFYDGRRLNGLPPWKTARSGIGRLFQDMRIFEELSVVENILISFAGRVNENPLAAIAFPSWIARTEAENKIRAIEYLDILGLASYSDAPAGTLSYGQQKLLAIGRLLAAKSDVLLLDEPTAGVHPKLTEILLRILKKLAANGRTVVLIEHDMNVVLEAADRIVYLNGGRFILEGEPDEVLSDRYVRASYLALSDPRSRKTPSGLDFVSRGSEDEVNEEFL